MASYIASMRPHTGLIPVWRGRDNDGTSHGCNPQWGATCHGIELIGPGTSSVNHTTGLDCAFGGMDAADAIGCVVEAGYGDTGAHLYTPGTSVFQVA